jgi:PAS domain S-box-containing protein
MVTSVHEDKRVPFSKRRRAENALRRNAERQAMLLEVTSDLIRASEPGELGRMTFEHVKSAFGAVVCTNYRLDPARQRLRLVFVHGIPPEHLKAAQSLKLGQEYCGAAAASLQPLVADKQRIACDPNGGLVRELGATAYACYPLKASDGRLLGTFAVASATRESFTDDEVAWLGTITNFLAQAWERFEAEQGLRASEERLRLSQEAADLGHWDYDYTSGTLVWSEQTRKLLGVEFGEPASRALLRSRVHPEDRPRLEEHITRSTRPGSDHIRHFEFRVVMPNGAVRWLEDQDRVETNAAGMPVRAVGVLRDITARKDAEEAQARFRATFENAAVGIAHFDPDFRWLRVNEALCRILGYRAGELVTKSLEEINHPDDLRTCLAQVERMRDRKIDSFAMDKRYRRKDSSIVWTRLTNGCVRKSDGSIDYFVCTFEDISARKHAEEELRKSEERFRSSVLHSPLPIVLFDDREQILALSQSWLEETGYSREELGSVADWTARAYGERSGEVLEHIRQIISTEPEAERTELMIRTKERGERVWSFVTSGLGAQSDGRRLFVCVAQDVTERKAHEEHVQLLLREINHRAKNMLSLVQAIARQTAAREPEDFVGRFTERIQALSANQDLLVRNEWQGVDLEELVRAQLAHFADLVGSRIAVRGPKLRLNAAAAQAIGLTLHELATNAGKYGALSTDRGHVDVRWGTNGNALTMSWTERDGPLVSPPERRGFGSTVIASMAKATIGGEVQLDYAPSGLVWRLTCPAANGAGVWGT